MTKRIKHDMPPPLDGKLVVLRRILRRPAVEEATGLARSTLYDLMARGEFSPPRRIANNPSAMQQDADEMMRTVLRYAPLDDYIRWMDNVLRDLQEGMTTRSWPAPGELVRACKANVTNGQQHGNAAHVESCMVDMMATWHAKFRSEMPSMGTPERTAELIRRGVLSSHGSATIVSGRAKTMWSALSTTSSLVICIRPPVPQEIIKECGPVGQHPHEPRNSAAGMRGRHRSRRP